ncbi:MAG: nitroreductase family deazaflavin-dependent oxidoreductase [Candidatus Limnocylindria bacterium]
MSERVGAVRISPLLRLAWRLHRWLYRASGGRIGSRVGPWSALLLDTRGRKSGELRTAGLNYLTDGGRLVVVASYAGEDRHPAWWLNLLADPRGDVQVGTERYPVTARELDGADRDRLWRLVVETDPSYATYQERTTRRIPVVALERVPLDSSPGGE